MDTNQKCDGQPGGLGSGSAVNLGRSCRKARAYECTVIPGDKLTREDLVEMVKFQDKLCVDPGDTAITDSQAPLRGEANSTLEEDVAWTRERLVGTDSLVVVSRDKEGKLIFLYIATTSENGCFSTKR